MALPKPPTLALLLLASLLLHCTPQPPKPHERHATELHMGTIVEITAIGPDRAALREAVAAAFAEVARVERLMTTYREDSDLSRVNRAAGGPPAPVDLELYDLIERALDLSEQTDGAFDVTFAGLKGLWDFDPKAPRLPEPAEIAERLTLVSWKRVVLVPERHAVGLARPGMRIDLGGIAKGYAVDRAIEVLAAHGVSRAMVNAGGDLRTLGRRPDRAWSVGVTHPRKPGEIFAKIPLEDQAVATSGDYEKYFEADGQRYCHIIDPRTGRPAPGCQSVTVLAREAWLADALATAIFVMGSTDGLALAERLVGIEALVIDRDGVSSVTSGLAGKVSWVGI